MKPITPEKARRVDRHVGEMIRSRRKELRLTQTDLAIVLGVTPQQVQKYERGVNRISSATLYEIAQILQTPLATFFDGLNDLSEGASTPAAPPEELISIYAKLNPLMRQKLIDLAMSMASKAAPIAIGAPRERRALSAGS